MRTTDPFLNAHLVAPFVFHIGGRLWPISIRDQMLRGRLAVDRLIDQELISADRRLAVVGAGMAGATATLRAASRGISTTLIEREAKPFRRHALCQTRWVNPTQYDWTASTWSAGSFPWPGTPGMPFHWDRAGRAYDLTSDWELQFANELARLSGRVDVQYSATLLSSPVAGGGQPPQHVTVQWRDRQGNQKAADFGAVLAAIGFGEERCYIGAGLRRYRAFEFWENDPFEQPFLACAHPPRVLISGAGDGALQDFLRISTRCKSADEILDKILRYVPAGLTSHLRDAEDRALREFVLGGGIDGHVDCGLLTALEVEYLQAAQWLLARPGIAPTLDKLLRIDEFASLKVLHSCTHLSPCYALNRFLALLIIRHIETRSPGLAPIRRAGHRLDDVQCVSHNPGQPLICHGQEHRVTAAAQANCTARPGAPASIGSFEVVIIRHGIEVPHAWWQTAGGVRAAMPPLRELLPSHFSL